MTQSLLSEEAMRDSLLGLRLPVDAASGPYADLALAAGLSGCAALIVIGLVRLVSRRRARPVAPSLTDRITALQTLPDDARRVGFLHLLKEVEPDRYAKLRDGLYRAAAEIDPEAEVLRRV